MSTSVTKVEETAEAVCGALHRLEWEHLGDVEGSSWFRRGFAPKDTRIEVVRSVLAPVVLVNVEYRNLHARPVKRGRIVMQIMVGPEHSQYSISDATERVVLRCLEIYRDVLEGTGVAGPENLKPLTTDDIPES